MARRISRRPSAEWRVVFLGFTMLCCFGALVGKLWYEQVLRGKQWAKKIAGQSEVTVRIPSMRGEIRDRNGLTLVTNRASYGVDFYLPDMERGYRTQFGNKVPVVGYQRTIRGMMTNMREADIVQIVNTTVMPRLDELDLAQDYNSERLQLHYRNARLVPFTYQEELDYETIARFSEHDLGLPGVDIAVKPVRQYVYGALAAHLLGYVGAPNDIDKLTDIEDYTFYQPDVEGKSQVELVYDKWIRGTPGVRVMQRSSKGVIMGEIRREAPKTGNNVYLTIDAKIQFITERALRAVGRGAAVVINPKNGDILAMASVPSYDPNIFIPSVSVENWNKVNRDETDPLTNRAIQGYAPGSTYKTVTALAGLRAGLPADRYYNCSGSVTYGNKAMKCWIAEKGGSHGSLSLPDALKHSCNCFFYQWGNAAGIDQIDAVGEQLGLGKRTGVPLSGESGGILPGPAWLQSVAPQERWSNGYTANTSIGQGSVEASPLQMAMVVATIANRGISYTPRLIARVVDQQGNDVKNADGTLVAPPEGNIRADLHAVGITDKQIESVRDGMRRVVDTGTGKRAQIKGVVVAGKTGTAQFWRYLGDGQKIKDNHTWFITFAPYDEPKYAVCVMVQGAKSGGGVSAPIAQKIIEESLALEKGSDPGVAPLAPAPGSFTPIELVEFKKSEAPAGSLADDRETAEHSEGPAGRARERQVIAEPNIRAKADARGKVKGQSRNVAAPPPPSARSPGLFQRVFGTKKNNPQPPTR